MRLKYVNAILIIVLLFFTYINSSSKNRWVEGMANYMPPINIFILCFNEEVLLPHTIQHYKRNLPSCKITIYDNESTDNSTRIAKDLGCDVISWSSNNILNEHNQTNIKNNCWKNVNNGWILMIDMDEWVNVTEEDLQNEMQNGATILNIKGYNIIGESMNEELSDINLHQITKGVEYDMESKKLCFLKNAITDMNYSLGAHTCDPKGDVKYSDKVYINKHMSSLGLPFLITKMRNRYERAKEMQKQGYATHYTDNADIVTSEYNDALQKSRIIL